jgi:hypothetical protein
MPRSLLLSSFNALGPLICSIQNWSENYESWGQLVGLLGRRSVRLKATAYTGQHKQKKRRHAFMPRVGFEPTISVLERAKTFCASDRTVIGINFVFVLCNTIFFSLIGPLHLNMLIFTYISIRAVYLSYVSCPSCFIYNLIFACLSEFVFEKIRAEFTCEKMDVINHSQHYDNVNLNDGCGSIIWT